MLFYVIPSCFLDRHLPHYLIVQIGFDELSKMQMALLLFDVPDVH